MGNIILIIAGCLLVAVGVWFAYVNKAIDKAGGSGLKSISIEGPAWLVMVCVGLAAVGWGSYRHEERSAQKTATQAEQVTEPTTPPTNQIFDEFPNGFTFGDNNELDRLWRACERGVWEDCDTLYFQSDIGSDYEYFGATCGQPDFREPSELWCDPQRNIDEGLLEP